MDISKISDIILETKPIIMDKRKAARVTEKGIADFVTETDISVQEFLKKRLNDEYPEIQFIGEEGHAEAVDYGKSVWILDPIDGTTNLIYDFAMSAVSLALYKGGEGVLGIVYNPFHDEIFTAEKGSGAYFNGERIHVSHAGALSGSLMCIGTSPYNKELADENFRIFCELFKRTLDIRRTGSAAIDLCYTACGRADGYFERNLKPWDYAAGSIVLEEAGGRVTDFNGDYFDIRRNSDIAASNGLIHGELLNIIKNS